MIVNFSSRKMLTKPQTTVTIRLRICVDVSAARVTISGMRSRNATPMSMPEEKAMMYSRYF